MSERRGARSNIVRLSGDVEALGLPPGGSGPDDPSMEARVAVLESGFAELKAMLIRIEAGQTDAAKELASLRRDLKETDLPAIRAQLASLDGKLQEKPSSKDFMTLSQSMNAIWWKAFVFALGLAGTIFAAAWGLHRQGIL